MESNTDYINLHEIEITAILLFSYLKLANIEQVDVLLLAQTISKIDNFSCKFILREMKDGSEILDIDSMLMSSYIHGYLEQGTRKILLKPEYIRNNVICQFDESTNDFYEFVANKYVNSITNETEYDGDFIGNLLYNYNIDGHNDRK